MKNKTLIWELCRILNITFKDVYIDYNNCCGEDVVYIKGEYVGYVEDFWKCNTLKIVNNYNLIGEQQ